MRQVLNACGQARETTGKTGVITLEVTYLRLDPVRPEMDTISDYMYQQIIYSSINTYGADVIIPKTLLVKPKGIILGREEFWSANVPDLIVTMVKTYWSHGNPMVSIDFDSDNLLTILKFCGTIYLQNDYKLFNLDNKVFLQKGLITHNMYTLSGTQEYTLKQLETLKNVLKNIRKIVIDTYEKQLIQAFQHNNTILKLEF